MTDRSSTTADDLRNRRRPAKVNREGYVLQVCEKATVLHLGCTDYPFTEEAITGRRGTFIHGQILQVARECVGIDSSDEGIAICEQHGYSGIRHGDVEKLEESLEPRPFDVIVAGEILEHLSRPGALLAALPSYLGPDGSLLVTVPNACTFKGFMRACAGADEMVHPDHVAYYSERTLCQLLERFGFHAVEIAYYSVASARRGMALLSRLAETPLRWRPHLCEGLIGRFRLGTGG